MCLDKEECNLRDREVSKLTKFHITLRLHLARFTLPCEPVLLKLVHFMSSWLRCGLFETDKAFELFAWLVSVTAFS